MMERSVIQAEVNKCERGQMKRTVGYLIIFSDIRSSFSQYFFFFISHSYISELFVSKHFTPGKAIKMQGVTECEMAASSE